VVREGLDRLADQLSDLAHDRVAWQASFNQQVSDMRHSTDVLRRETQSLSTALRRPQVRGRWGELHLRRTVELAGMVAHCDFTEQHQLAGGSLRPDLVVHLAGGRQVVVDAKVPLDAFLDATAAEEPDERDHHLARHAAQLRAHVDTLGAKAYWRALPQAPEFVVLFVPAESFLSAALESDAGLLEHAATRHVVLATPSTLIALLRTVAHGWSHERLASAAAEVQRLGRELHERLATMGGHVDRLGRSLDAAVTAYNQAVGSLEGRVLVSARRFRDLGVTDVDLAEPRQVESVARAMGAAELSGEWRALEEVQRPGGPDLESQLRDEATGPTARRAEGA
jgi:DNA recombination protein RmuC